MKKIPAAFLLVLILAGRCRADDDPLRAQTDGSRLWVTVTVPISTATTLPTAETRLFIRPSGVGQKWQSGGTISGEIRSLSSRVSASESATKDQDVQLSAVLEDGSWVTLWDGGSASGAPLPGDGKMMAVADSGDGSRWAVGMIPGGLIGARQAASATTEPTTRTTTRPTLSSTVELPVLFQQTDGRWVPKAELPDAATRQWLSEPTAIWAGKDRVVLMVLDGKGNVVAYSWQTKTGWKIEFNRKSASADRPAFGLLAGANPGMWVQTGTSEIELCADFDHLDRKILLTWTGGSKVDFHPAVVFCGGLFRVFTVNDSHQIVEHDFTPDGQRSGEAVLDLPLGASDMSAPTWIEAVLMGMLTFTTVVVGYRQVTRMRNPEALVASPVPAPFGRRLMAGLFDLSPVLLVVIIVSGLHSFSSWSTGDWIAVLAAFLFYWIWVTVFEVTNGRSLGKLMLGLRVVTIEGRPVSKGHLMIRNLLRPVDPLLLIVVSPLGQRTADFVADTMVVAEDEPADGAGDPAQEKRPPGKSAAGTPSQTKPGPDPETKPAGGDLAEGKSAGGKGAEDSSGKPPTEQSGG